MSRQQDIEFRLPAFRRHASSSPVRQPGKIATDLTVTVDGEAALELHVDGPPGVIQGTVRNAAGVPVRNAQVVLVPSVSRRSNPNVFTGATSDSNGAFTIRGVTPDDYQVLAFEKLEPGAYQDSEFVMGFENRAVAIAVRKGSVGVLNLTAISR